VSMGIASEYALDTESAATRTRDSVRLQELGRHPESQNASRIGTDLLLLSTIGGGLTSAPNAVARGGFYGQAFELFVAPMLLSPKYVQVIVPLPLEKEYTYRIPGDKIRSELPGSRVRVRFSGRSLIGIVTRVVDAPSDGRRILDVEEVMDDVPSLPPELLSLTRWMAEYYACSWGEAARAALPPDGKAPQKAFIRLEPEADSSAVRGVKQKAVLAVLEAHGPDSMLLADVLDQAGAGHGTIRSLRDRGMVHVELGEPPLPDGGENGGAITLDRFHPTQRSAAEALRDAIDRARYHTFLLHGVTGSGKTEVYIDALSRVIQAGKTGIVLVPEIALTPQTVRRFRSQFGSGVAVLHSRLSSGNRFDTWRRVRRGDFKVVIGPRSAVMAPVPDVGLIVVDEEHEASYKQFEPAPRYNARDVAVMRAASAGAVCVLGSATPSLESYFNATSGKYTLLSMPDRVPVAEGRSARLPTVRVVDMLGDRTPDRPHPIISRALESSISDRLERGEQTILLQNRRGFSPVLSCDTCGHVPECPDCSVSLTWHKAHRELRCHYCGRGIRKQEACPSCGRGTMEAVGAGTQRVEEELERLFPSVRLLRMDLDTTTRKDSHDRILQAFGAGDADILVGTQMVAKGLDFANVTLVGVVDADAGLLFPDFRADERTFQLLTQVAGRAGRSALPGEVVFQTRNSRHPIIRLARRHDYLRFAEAALSSRQALNYPPFARAVRIEFRGPEEAGVRRLSDRFAKVFRTVDSGMELVGPAPAFIARVRRLWRYLALLKVPRTLAPARVRALLEWAKAESGPVPRGYRINVDVDPMGLL
jgi:primosomal protein N' (replication factor Y) (superfamily II helicase)